MKKPLGIKRRTLVKGMTASALIPLLSGNLIGCSDDSDRYPGSITESVPAEFLHGVASGDPKDDGVILWTRVTPERDGEVLVEWEIASDESFVDVVDSGSGTTSAAVDYTVKVDVSGLEPGGGYFYRFRTGNRISPTGRTRTVATGALSLASFAVVSCANLPSGFFNVYRDIAEREADAVLHLGDYIYEYGRDYYSHPNAEEWGRLAEPPGELLSLADYRTRYAQYRTDVDLQDCHAAHPFIVVWDDHEVADNSWRDGAEKHDPETEGEFSERRAAAIQAWYEWLPVRPPTSEREITYRSFRYGDLLDLIMLDTRHIGRDLQVSYDDYFNGATIEVDGARAAMEDSTRTMLGTEQLEWLKATLTDSTARWQVLGQQVVMARQLMPEPITRAVSPAFDGDTSLEEATVALLAAVAAKNKPPEERSQQEQALLDSAIPFNPDAWDGYAFEREDLLNHAAQLQSRLVVLSGDSHTSWASQLTTADGSSVGVEFAGSSVTSPGGVEQLGKENALLFTPYAVVLIDDLKYTNLVNRGYMHITFAADEVKCEYRFVDSIETRDYSLDESAGRVFTVSREEMLLS